MSRTRVSRTLIGFLSITIALGAVAYFHNLKKSRAAEKKDQPVSPVPPTVAQKQPQNAGPTTRSSQIAVPTNSVLITQTPSGNNTPTNNNTTTAKPPAVETKQPAPAVDSKRPEPVSPSMGSSGNVIAQGKALLEQNQLVAGRRVLNEALVGGKLNAAEAQTAMELIAKANETLVFSPRRVSDDTYSGGHVVQSGERPTKIAAACDVTWEFLGRINNIPDARRLRASQTIKTVKGPFHAVVSKSKFTMDVYFGSPGEKGAMYVRTFKVGLGKHGSTPTGTWMVAPQAKLKNPKWWGTADEPAREADDPQNPLGEFWIGLAGTDGEAVGKQGFGIHGTIEPETIGQEKSHGCIRLLAADIEKVYEMLVDGKSTIIVKD